MMIMRFFSSHTQARVSSTYLCSIWFIKACVTVPYVKHLSSNSKNVLKSHTLSTETFSRHKCYHHFTTHTHIILSTTTTLLLISIQSWLLLKKVHYCDKNRTCIYMQQRTQLQLMQRQMNVVQPHIKLFSRLSEVNICLFIVH